MRQLDTPVKLYKLETMVLFRWAQAAKVDTQNNMYCIYKSNTKYTGELGYEGPLYDGYLHMTDDMPGPNPMHIKY